MRSRGRSREEKSEIAVGTSVLQNGLILSARRVLPGFPSNRLAGSVSWFHGGFISEAPEPQNVIGCLEEDSTPLAGLWRTRGHLCSCFQATDLRKAHQGVPAARVQQGGAPL